MSGLLIVDDNKSFLEAASILLEREGLSIAGVASTGADALRQVEALHPDVVLVDIFLGEESGLDLTKRLVQDGVVKEAPVILISTHSRADLEDLITYMSYGHKREHSAQIAEFCCRLGGPT